MGQYRPGSCVRRPVLGTEQEIIETSATLGVLEGSGQGLLVGVADSAY